MHGLTEKEIIIRKKNGKVNKSKTKKTSIETILARNIFTIFNLVNGILAFLIFIAHSYKNALFIFIALANTCIGIINEVRAKRIIDKLKLISEQKIITIRNGVETKINNEEIVEDDIIVYSLGSQVTVDCIIVDGEVEVNESFITGESDNLLKRKNDKLFAGSFIVSGNCFAKVVSIGNDNFIANLSNTAQSIKQSKSQLFGLLNQIVKFISFALIPIGILLFLNQLRAHNATFEIAVTSTVAALINMIPEGLVLLTSSVLALSSIRLAKKKILIQDLYSIETLARVDTICLDKTGTITTGNMDIENIIPACGHSEKDLKNNLLDILSYIPADNATSKALKKYFKNDLSKHHQRPAMEIIPFSSDRKYSGIKNNNIEILMGALEFITKNKTFIKQTPSTNHRVLSIVKKTDKNEDLIGFVVLKDEIRKNAQQIINYFNDNQIDIKIISGDNLKTVKSIAESVGLSSSKAIDISGKSQKEIQKLATEYNIFARVRPEQKKDLILALKKSGHTVAMTGDGVNDVLAMKEADCSISINDGTDAARRAANIVLLKSDFALIPNIVSEGRRTINNIERSATLFLSKTVYSSMLAIAFIFIRRSYPFIPIEMSLLNVICIGCPAFILALEKNEDRVKNRFIYNIVHYSIPTGITNVINILLITLISSFLNIEHAQLITISAITTFIIGLTLIYEISKPLTKARVILFSILTSIAVLVFIIKPLRVFFGFSILTKKNTIITAILVLFSIILSRCLKMIASKKFLQK